MTFLLQYQDANIVQYDLIKLMTMQDNNKSVTIVGGKWLSIRFFLFIWSVYECEYFKYLIYGLSKII